MKPLSERDENPNLAICDSMLLIIVGMKPLSERDENFWMFYIYSCYYVQM